MKKERKAWTRVETYKPILIAENTGHVIVKIANTEYLISQNAYFKIKDMTFCLDKRRKQTYPLLYAPARTSLKSLIFGGRCYTISADRQNLLESNLTDTSHVQYIGDDIIKVHIGNGKSFLANVDQLAYVQSHKLTILHLKNGYPYVCRMTKVNGKRKLELFHRIVAGATETSQHCDHINFNTLDNRKHNIQIVSLYENISRHNPAKAGKRKGKWI